MKYLVKKNIPLILGIKKGDIIDSNDKMYSILDLRDTSFFEAYIETSLVVGDHIICSEFDFQSKDLCEIISENGNNFTVKNLKNGKSFSIKKKSKYKIPTYFWFINSNGELQSDYEERPRINKLGLEFKKKIGNYFSNKEDCQKHKEKLLK
mgnify:CR=1 FL=1